VTDPEPAADADLDAARALLLAAGRFDEPRYGEAGRALGRAVTEHATMREEDPILVAGPWARENGVVNPSYWSPRALDVLGLPSVRRLVAGLTEDGLPPDWAKVESWGVVPTGPPSGDADPGYAYDAMRLPVRFAESCHAEDRALAARLWPRLRISPGAPHRALDGTPLTGDEHPAALAGAAAAAHAAGDPEAAEDLLDRAADLDAEHPTYYGAAWVALTRTMLLTDALGACAER
jgi:hypothetical protein